MKNIFKKKNNKFEKAKLAMEMKLYLYKKLITSVLISKYYNSI